MSADTRDETLATVCACGERRGHHAAKDDACPLNPGAPLGQEKYHPVFKFRAAAPSATPSEPTPDDLCDCGHRRGLHYDRFKRVCSVWIDDTERGGSYRCQCAAFVEPRPAPTPEGARALTDEEADAAITASAHIVVDPKRIAAIGARVIAMLRADKQLTMWREKAEAWEAEYHRTVNRLITERTASEARVSELERENARLSLDMLGAERLAGAVCTLIDRGALDARSLPADALLDYATTRYGSSDPIGEVRKAYKPKRASLSSGEATT